MESDFSPVLDTIDSLSGDFSVEYSASASDVQTIQDPLVDYTDQTIATLDDSGQIVTQSDESQASLDECMEEIDWVLRDLSDVATNIADSLCELSDPTYDTLENEIHCAFVDMDASNIVNWVDSNLHNMDDDTLSTLQSSIAREMSKRMGVPPVTQLKEWEDHQEQRKYRFSLKNGLLELQLEDELNNFFSASEKVDVLHLHKKGKHGILAKRQNPRGKIVQDAKKRLAIEGLEWLNRQAGSLCEMNRQAGSLPRESKKVAQSDEKLNEARTVA
jgi:hypothetical protein